MAHAPCPSKKLIRGKFVEKTFSSLQRYTHCEGIQSVSSEPNNTRMSFLTFRNPNIALKCLAVKKHFDVQDNSQKIFVGQFGSSVRHRAR